jgi:hypothetical protein
MNNQPAFPGLHPSKECRYSDAGMTLFDYFAAKAMAAELVDGVHRDGFPNVAERAYRMAEAMMAERAKRGL